MIMISKKNKIISCIFILLFSISIFNQNTNLVSSMVLQESDTVDYLIITVSEFGDTLIPLKEWKSEKGLVTEIVFVEDIDTMYTGVDMPAKIKECIRDYYENHNLKWVLLAGDVDKVPARYVRIYDGYPYDGDYITSDLYYVELSNDWDSNSNVEFGERNIDDYDYDAELYIGRLPASLIPEMIDFVQKLIKYEKNPPLSTWMTNAMYAGALLYFSEDYNNNNITDFGEFELFDNNRVNNYMKNQTLPEYWSSTFLGEIEGEVITSYPYDLPLTESNVVETINGGNGIGMLSAHGSFTSISRKIFTFDYDNDSMFDYTADPYYSGGVPINDTYSWDSFVNTGSGLDSGDKLGLYWISACNAGSFDLEFDCLSEYFLKNAAIGCLASSYVSWCDDFWYEREQGGWFNEGFAFRFWEQLFKDANSTHPGMALVKARSDYIDDRAAEPVVDAGGYPYAYEWEDKILRSINLLGDPEVAIWTEIPEKYNVTELEEVEVVGGSNSYTAVKLVATLGGFQAHDGIVTLTNEDGIVWKGEIGISGEVYIPMTMAEIGGLKLTVYRHDALVYQQMIEETPLNETPFNITFSFLAIATIAFISRKTRN